MKLLVTGTAGFVGYFTAKNLLNSGHEIVGVDNINDYYDISLKYDRLNNLKEYSNFIFYKKDLSDLDSVNEIFKKEKPQRVIHLAAQPGVRYSLKYPEKYIQSNIVAFMNLLEACRNFGIEHLAYASSSSVYGLNGTYPLSVKDNVDHPVSLYAATKKSNELMAHTYSHLFNIPTTGLRFFTVYGPMGRPDMAYFSFAKRIIEGQPIEVFNEGKMFRDFTYIDDIVEGVIRVAMKVPESNPAWDSKNPDPSSSLAPYRVYNIGCNSPVNLMDFIREIEKNLGKQANMKFLPMQPGDVVKTHADVDDLVRDLDYKPKIDYRTGVRKFIEWFVEYWESEKSNVQA